MNKRLTIEYDGVTVWDGDVQEYQFGESASGVVVSGSVVSAAAAKPPAGGFVEVAANALATAVKRQTAATAERKRLAYEAESEQPADDPVLVDEVPADE